MICDIISYNLIYYLLTVINWMRSNGLGISETKAKTFQVIRNYLCQKAEKYIAGKAVESLVLELFKNMVDTDVSE